MEGNEQAVRAALEHAATNPKCVLQVLDLAAKLNKEVGHPSDGRGAETHFHIHTNVNIMALEAAASGGAERKEGLETHAMKDRGGAR